MRTLGSLWGVAGCLILFGSPLAAQGPLPTAAENGPDAVEGPAAPSTEPPASRLYTPWMFGDVLGPTANLPAGGNRLTVVAPVAFRSSFAISENESPRPYDRVFSTFNYFNNVDHSLLAAGSPSANLYRELFGFEKTFLDGDASVGLRLPYLQMAGNPGLADTHIGDLSVILKYAFLNDRATGNLTSGGLVVTAPTGQELRIPGQSPVNSTILQPWIGSIYNWDKLYLQGFLSFAIPTDARDVSLFFKDFALGYWLYRASDGERLLTAVVPQAELHINTPLNHQGSGRSPIGYSDNIAVTGGCYFFFNRAIWGVAVGAPVTGPLPYDYEVITNLNFRF
jgi:hypothetical protein